MKPTLIMALVVAGLCTTRDAAAQLQFAGDAPQIYSIQPREHRFLHELHVGAGALPVNAYYVGVAINAGYTYHFSDLWAWEVLNGFFAFNFNTGLEGTLQSLGAGVDPLSTQRVAGMLSTNVLVKPLFGKIAVFNRAAIQAETYFTAGVGVVEISQPGQSAAVSFAPDIGLGLDFWMNRHFAMRFDVRNYLAFVPGGITDILMIGLAVSYNFWEPGAPDLVPGPG